MRRSVVVRFSIPFFTVAHGKCACFTVRNEVYGREYLAMVSRLFSAKSQGRAGWWLGAFVAHLCLPALALAGGHHKKTDDAGLPSKAAQNAAQSPAFSIPVEPLGFFAPGPYFQGQRVSLVSLDFLDENRLLFTFRAPGLIHRSSYGENERQIRAVTLSLPEGSVAAEALWTLHDHDRYLWMLRDGHFLVRDKDLLKQGDASLELTPLLQFPGPVLSLQMDPTQQFMVTDSSEPALAKPKMGQVGSPVTAQASVTTGDQDDPGAPDLVLRILQRASGKVMLVSRIRTVVQLPISPDGYLETLRGSGRNWLLSLNYFTGGSKILGKVESLCQPPATFISRTEVLANTCLQQGGRALVAVSTEGSRLWVAPSSPTQVWPLLVISPDGSSLARETLTVSHPIDMYSPLSFDDVTGQLVEVFDAVEGTLRLKAKASPVFDGGGNVAISPSGKRVAVLNAGAIQVYELPGPAAGGRVEAPQGP
jgi:hypothetical protein